MTKMLGTGELGSLIKQGDRFLMNTHANSQSGGIPSHLVHALEEIWSVMPDLKAKLFSCYGVTGFMKLNVPPAEFLSIILEDADFQKYRAGILAESEQRLKVTASGDKDALWRSSKVLIEHTITQIAKGFSLKLQNLVENYPGAWPDTE